ncbi:LysR family transcriptional regulator [Ensifer sp. Root127]|uniref:LysR family transcriptional regulator n=1 Tax=Ensifer sp. Root127 TaxID=1736440 RepID=UPI000709F98C|nr:LysR family transcriptional regulator [Ensifer sp. Root127]KQW72442.1 LysR family transcriptional regulator [Ensifer sp. Root127]
MKRDEFNDLAAFLLIAEQRSFSRAASKLGISASGLSHAMRLLEERLGVRLLSRTTRSVSTTEAGERLLATLRPAFEDISASLADLRASRESPSGSIRVTASRHAADTIIKPLLPKFLSGYPDIRIEIVVDDGLTDIVSERFDAGIRFGRQIARDMIAVRVGPDIRAAIVAAPSYFESRQKPETLIDLNNHSCINYRLATGGGLYAWELGEGDSAFQVRVDGPLIVNDVDLKLGLALAGQGLAYCFEDQVAGYIAEGRLVRVLESFCPPFPGYHLYYTNRRQTPRALTAFIETVRFRS